MGLDGPSGRFPAPSPAAVDKGEAYAAVERAAKRLISARHEGEVTPERVAESLANLPPSERALAQKMYERLSEQVGDAPVTREVIRAFVDERSEEIRQASLEWNLSPQDIAQLGETGKLAVDLARKLKAVDVLEGVAYAAFDGLDSHEVMAKVRELSATHVELGYSMARLLMFSDLDNWQGLVRGVYTDSKVDTLGIPDVEIDSVNTEHTWPKARGVKATPAASDLHHLFPADREANTARGNHPFGEVVTPLWEKDGARLGEDKDGQIVFEPPERHRGNIARALFYVAAVYDLPFPPGERKVLAAWNTLDPVDAGEFLRNDAISKVQGNRNLFVDHPALIDAVVGGAAVHDAGGDGDPSDGPPLNEATRGDSTRGPGSSATAPPALSPSPTTVHLNQPALKLRLPRWFPKGTDLGQMAQAVGELAVQQGFPLDDVKGIKSLTFADADHTFLKTDAPILLRNLQSGALMRHPKTKELLTLPNRGFREAYDELVAEFPDVAWDDWEYAFEEMGSRHRILDTPAIPSTMNTLRRQDRRPDAHAHIITARGARGAAEGLREYLDKRHINPGVIFTPNADDQARVLHLDDDDISSQQRKALTMGAALHLYQEGGAPLEEVSFYDDSDGNLRAAMELLPAVFPEIRFSFFDIIHVGGEKFRHRLVASSLGPGELGTPDGKLMRPRDIATYRSDDAPLPPPVAR